MNNKRCYIPRIKNTSCWKPSIAKLVLGNSVFLRALMRGSEPWFNVMQISLSGFEVHAYAKVQNEIAQNPQIQDEKKKVHEIITLVIVKSEAGEGNELIRVA